MIDEDRAPSAWLEITSIKLKVGRAILQLITTGFSQNP